LNIKNHIIILLLSSCIYSFSEEITTNESLLNINNYENSGINYLEEYDTDFFSSYLRNLNEELQDNPFYYVWGEYDLDIFVEEQAIDSLTKTLIDRYYLFKQIDYARQKVQDTLTASYESDEVKFHIRPGLKRIQNQHRIILRCDVSEFLGTSKIKARIGKDYYNIKFGKNRPLIKGGIYLEYELTRDSYFDNDYGNYEDYIEEPDEWDEIVRLTFQTLF